MKIFFFMPQTEKIPLNNPYFRAKSKLPIFKNGQFSKHFFWDFFGPKIFKKMKNVMGKKFWKCFWHSKKYFFGHFLWKKIQKTFGKFLKGEKFFKIFFELFFKKVSENIFFEFFKTFSHNILHLFETFWSKKKCPPNCPFSKTDSFGFVFK